MKLNIVKLILLFFLFPNILFAQNQTKNITLQLSWFDQFQFAGYYMAKEKGFYNDVGLDVTIKPFEFGLDIPLDVSNGKFDFAIGRETLILERANNKDIVALYALFQASPLVLLSTKESGINSIKDFENKKIMTTIDDASEVSIKAMIVSQKLDIEHLEFIQHTHNINDLINKNTDVISAYTSKSPYHLQKMGIDYNLFAPKDFGFDMYSDLLYTSKSKVINDLDTVQKFKKASLKGWEYAYANIEESVELILEKYNPQNLTKSELLFEGQELKKLSYYNTTTLGELDLNKLQRIYDLYNVMGLVNSNIDMKDFILIDNEFITYIKNVWDKLSKYKELPYIYFFLTLFFILILLLIYKHLMLHKVNKELKILSQKDHLTNLYNRRYFESIATKYLSLAREEKKDVCVVVIDIDNFKKVNDTYGHQAGDSVLCSLATIMNENKRDSDIIARFGGEEFAIFLPNTTIETAKKYVQNLRENIEQRSIKLDNTTLNITVSIGLTLITKNDTLDTALDRADQALYISKNNGKNQIQIILQ